MNGIAGIGTGLFSAGFGARGGGAGRQAQVERQVQRLRAIDEKVRQHEAAHQASGAGLTSGASYQYVRGPDGRQYAVSGEVRIDASAAGTPEATLAKAKQIQAAALAPADPSAQDRAVAAQASLMESQARREIREDRRAEDEGGKPSPSRVIAAYQDVSVLFRRVDTFA